ncbi:MAG: hypothetical protein ACLUZ6_03585 [Lachnospira eligens]
MSELEEGKNIVNIGGEVIDKDCVVCPKCGKQVEALKDNSTPVIINNSAASSSSAASAIAMLPQKRKRNIIIY